MNPRDRMSRAGDKRALAAVRAILLGRRDRPTRSDTAYTIYVIVIGGLVVVFPIVRAIMIGLSVPEISAWALDAWTPRTMPLALLLLSLAVVLFGRLRGPIVPPEPFIDLVVASPIGRHLSLRRFARRGEMASVLLALIGAAILLGGVGLAGSLSVPGALLFLVSCVLGGVHLSVFWLIGQLSTPLRRYTILALGALAALAAFAAFLPGGAVVSAWLGPWGWIAQTWGAAAGGVDAGAVVAFALLTASLLSVRWTGAILSQLTRDDLASQARRWGTVVSLATTGDVKSAANRLKSTPRRGRHWTIRFPAHPVVATVVRDVVGIARFPMRTIFWAIVSVISGGAIAWPFAIPSDGTLIAYAAPLIAYFAVGGWAEGLRAYATTIGASSPFGTSARVQVLAHLIAPGLIAGVLMLVGAGIVLVATGGAALTRTVLWITLLVLFLTIMQAFSALKGLLPLGLLAPVPTPMGDLSMISVALWLADAATLVLVVGGGLTALVAGTGITASSTVLILAATAFMAWWARARLGRLTRPAV